MKLALILGILFLFIYLMDVLALRLAGKVFKTPISWSNAFKITFVVGLVAALATIVLLILAALIDESTASLLGLATIQIACSLLIFHAFLRIFLGTDFPKNLKIFILRSALLALFVLSVLLPIRHWVATPFKIRGHSMEPAFKPGDHFFVLRNVDGLNRGEVVTYVPEGKGSTVWVARIVGLPREEISIANGGVQIDGRDLSEPYLTGHFSTPGQVRVQLGPDEYYMLGDNRENAVDSRSHGPVAQERVEGRFWFFFLKGRKTNSLH